MFQTRVFAALATAIVLSACGAQPLPGTARAPQGQLEAMRRVKAGPAPEAIAFEHLVVNEVSALRDGGTIVAKGYVTRSTYVTVKLDGSLSSKTRGTIFVGSHDFTQPDGELRPALATELAPLAKALEGNATRAGANLNVQALLRLAEAAEKAAATPAPAAGAGALTDLAIEKLPVRCPCFELKARLDGKALVVRFEGMPGGYTVDSCELDGRQVTGDDRAPIAAALKAGAAAAGPRAMMVEDVAEALLAK